MTQNHDKCIKLSSGTRLLQGRKTTTQNGIQLQRETIWNPKTDYSPTTPPQPLISGVNPSRAIDAPHASRNPTLSPQGAPGP
eukprot:4350157-Pyramimonas_sp.AAC.1